jgi:hypothetical protein
MVNWSKLPVDLAEASTSIKESVPSQLQPPEAAPISPKKALRQGRQAIAKTTKPKTPTKLQTLVAAPTASKAPPKSKQASAKTAKTAVAKKTAVTAKAATKTARSSSPRSAVVPKAKRSAS